MKILFVSSGNSGKISPIILNQAISLLDFDENLSIDYFLITKKGIWGYLFSINQLRRKIKSYNPNVIHAHYALCGIISALAFTHKPIVSSLMGSDVMENKGLNFIIKFFTLFFWKACIVKSQEMWDCLDIKNIHIIPNGVNIEEFIPLDKISSKHFLKLPVNKRIILFGSDPSRTEKNYPLFEKAVEIMHNDEVYAITLKNIPNEIIKYYFNAADILVLTSFNEGSPNVIKEAMACSLPIVSTDVGDVKWVIRDTEGCYIATFDPSDCASKIKMALAFTTKNERTTGRDRIIELGLDTKTVAKRLIEIYENMAN